MVLILKLKSRMNNNRLSSNLNKISNDSPLDTNSIFSIPSPYEIIDGIRYKRGTSTKVYTKLS